MGIPAPIQDQLEKLDKLVEEYPLKIPVNACAAFLGMNNESLRACLEYGACPFGLGWIKNNAQNRAFYIPTLTFYLWVTQSATVRK